ncbi:hypothetical protein TetV_514 [Tetraselmis virus 1]|uniref:Uncharacterized protein n=1 Tax=Tetraselmis virus 1 TaxID=2060617 RepID=A0A2P0VNW1_9VIRU|nr:hypothetical protein QJ968_gp540 [Tetraselmis virus 1]AUF82596.1 hypothetical protein TetV_514 [Tetraselmis virus 1]
MKTQASKTFILKVLVFLYLLSIPFVKIGDLGTDAFPLFIVGCVIGAGLLYLDVTLGTLVLLALAITMILMGTKDDELPKNDTKLLDIAEVEKENNLFSDVGKSPETDKVKGYKPKYTVHPRSLNHVPTLPVIEKMESKMNFDDLDSVLSNESHAFAQDQKQEIEDKQNKDLDLVQDMESDNQKFLLQPDGIFVTDENLHNIQNNLVGSMSEMYCPIGTNVYTTQGRINGSSITGVLDN